MLEKIDEELEKFSAGGKAPIQIILGSDFYDLIPRAEPYQGGTFAAPLVGPGQKAPVYGERQRPSYKGIPVTFLQDRPANHIEIKGG